MNWTGAELDRATGRLDSEPPLPVLVSEHLFDLLDYPFAACRSVHLFFFPIHAAAAAARPPGCEGSQLEQGERGWKQGGEG